MCPTLNEHAVLGDHGSVDTAPAANLNAGATHQASLDLNVRSEYQFFFALHAAANSCTVTDFQFAAHDKVSTQFLPAWNLQIPVMKCAWWNRAGCNRRV